MVWWAIYSPLFQNWWKSWGEGIIFINLGEVFTPPHPNSTGQKLANGMGGASANLYPLTAYHDERGWKVMAGQLNRTVIFTTHERMLRQHFTKNNRYVDVPPMVGCQRLRVFTISDKSSKNSYLKLQFSILGCFCHNLGCLSSPAALPAKSAYFLGSVVVGTTYNNLIILIYLI
ncbi:MAG: hypothetical protein ACOYK8_05940 [Alphaproteobacteria bacterium]